MAAKQRGMERVSEEDGEQRCWQWSKREWANHVVEWRMGCIAARGQWSLCRVVTECTGKAEEESWKLNGRDGDQETLMLLSGQGLMVSSPLVSFPLHFCFDTIFCTALIRHETAWHSIAMT